jgi:hypothetical protein
VSAEAGAKLLGVPTAKRNRPLSKLDINRTRSKWGNLLHQPTSERELQRLKIELVVKVLLHMLAKHLLTTQLAIPVLNPNLQSRNLVLNGLNIRI